MSAKSDRGTRRPIEQAQKGEDRQPVGEPVTKECGCTEQEFSDGTVDIQPCIAHGFVQVANEILASGQKLVAAANALGFVGLKLAEQERVAREGELVAPDLPAASIEEAKATGRRPPE